jgi:hypothetical protein
VIGLYQELGWETVTALFLSETTDRTEFLYHGE